jgi:hypothetical protein
LKLCLSIFLSGLLGIFGPIGIYILCAIIVGVIFRPFVLLNDIHKQVVPVGSRDRATEAYEKYLEEKKNDSNNK